MKIKVGLVENPYDNDLISLHDIIYDDGNKTRTSHSVLCIDKNIFEAPLIML